MTMPEDLPEISAIVLPNRNLPRYDVQPGQVRLYKRGATCAAPGAKRNRIVRIRAANGGTIHRLAVFSPSIHKYEMVLDIDSIYELLGEDSPDSEQRTLDDGTRIICFPVADRDIDVVAKTGWAHPLFVLRLGLTHPDRIVRLAVNLGVFGLVLGLLSVVLGVISLTG